MCGVVGTNRMIAPTNHNSGQTTRAHRQSQPSAKNTDDEKQELDDVRNPKMNNHRALVVGSSRAASPFPIPAPAPTPAPAPARARTAFAHFVFFPPALPTELSCECEGS